jgi:hypothetical protein
VMVLERSMEACFMELSVFLSDSISWCWLSIFCFSLRAGER